MENEFKEVPIEVQNLHHSQAHKAWSKYVDSDKGKSDSLKMSKVINDLAEAKEFYDVIKSNWIALFKSKEQEKWFRIERDKDAFNEMQTAMTAELDETKAMLAEARERLVKLQAPTIR